MTIYRSDVRDPLPGAKARVLEDLAAFEAEGLIVLEAHPDGRRWRVLPPDTDPA